MPREYLKVLFEAIPPGQFTSGYSIGKIPDMDNYERLQELLIKIRTHYCGGVSAELARRISQDASYVNRLFYPREKNGAKGVGPKVQEACKTAFNLPRGFWDMDPSEAFLGDEPIAVKAASQVKDTDNLEINEYATGGAMGDGLVLRDQPGMIHSWRVTREWVQKNVHNFTAMTNLAIVTGFGDSMRPLYNPGDPLLVDTGVKTVDFDGIYFFRIGDEGFVKRLQRIPGDGLLVISENKSYRDWTIKPEMDLEVFARVVKVWRGDDF